MEQQLELPTGHASEPDQRLEPDHAAGDALLQLRPARDTPGEFARDAGLGDLTLLELLSPANSGNWVLGAGPTAIFPTAMSGFTGQGKWQLGPSIVAGYLTKQFFIGVFPQQWWSIGGERGRPDTNQMNLQPIRRSSSAMVGASDTRAISWRTGLHRLRTSGRSQSDSAWARW